MKSPQPSLARRGLVMKAGLMKPMSTGIAFQKIEITSLASALRLPVELAMMQS